MTDFDSIVPHELFKFLANAETNAGELAQYAVRLARHEVSLEVLRAKESSEAKELLQAAGMVDEMHLQCMLGKLHEPDARFALEKKVAVSSLRFALTSLFKVLDEDGSGELDLGEYLALSHTVPYDYQRMFPTTFLALDEDQSGKVSLDEWISAMQNPPDATAQETEEYEDFIMQVKIYLKGLPKPESQIDRVALATKVFQAFDVDNSGTIDLKDFLSLAPNEQAGAVMTAWFQYMDRIGNRDGKVQLDEWLAASAMYNKHTPDEDFERDQMALLEVMEWLNSSRAAAA